ncbi:hypothetical protein [Paenibacillus sp. UMB4589-SE434]|uniref:hypothetical protein n=1 Tax=Paenibacillus sp. UMB4589-SE434 TaxID=3046314 RepID=UPI00254FA439|nr:hypothetical protein [Paenibacillus sp. UMB4589-SE434]MDK8180750.1 hypothetical protein [Paenibacillus sp. UMB4589-SE434]
MPKMMSKLIWLIGAIALVWLNNKVLDYGSMWSSKEYVNTYNVIAKVLVAFWSGAYLALIGGLRRRKPIQKMLLLGVSLPCLFIVILPYLSWNIPYVNVWLFELMKNSYHVTYFSIASGFTAMLSFFRFQI